MNRFAIVFLSLLLFFMGASAQTKPSTHDNIELARSQKCLQPWLDGVDFIIRNDPTDSAPSIYREVIANGAFAKPIVAKGDPAYMWLSTAPNPAKPWVGLVPICSEANLPFPWKKSFDKADFLAEYDPGVNAIVLRTSIGSPMVVRGLALLHEMRHVFQTRNPLAKPNPPGYKLFKEVDAYEFEFKILDHLKLPGYNSFLDYEVRRVREAYRRTGHAQPNLTDPRLDKIFPDIGIDPVARRTAASLILFRASFLLYDLDNPQEATNLKMSMMASVGYR